MDYLGDQPRDLVTSLPFFLPSREPYVRKHTLLYYDGISNRLSPNLIVEQPASASTKARTLRTHARVYHAVETRTHTYAHLTRHSEVRWKPRTLFSESIESLHRPASGHLRSTMTTCTYYARFVANNALHDAPLGRRSPPRVIIIIPRTPTPPPETHSPQG